MLNETPNAFATIIIISSICMPYDNHNASPNIKSIYITGEISSSLFVRMPLIICGIKPEVVHIAAIIPIIFHSIGTSSFKPPFE